MKKPISRRKFLKGTLGGAAVTVGLPFLEIFLNANGNALASGLPIPKRFGTWFWGLGMNREIFVPKTVGAGFDLPEEMASLAPVRDHINVFSNFDTTTDGRPNICHYTGWVVLRCGTAPSDRSDLAGQSVDVMMAEAIGRGTPFRQIDVNATGDARDTHSFRGRNAYNVPETSPVAFYQRIFGPQFQDPNSPTFTPNPKIMAEKSVLSGVIEQTASLSKALGADDRARLDQYFTGLRDMENQLAYFLEKPEPRPACHAPGAITEEMPLGLDAELIAERHKLMSQILVMALACDQTRVFNMTYSNSFAATVKKGHEKSHHTETHEELVDPELGYQPMVSWYTRRSMEAWSYFVQQLANFPEGDGTLLDNALVYAHSDQSFAKVHSLEGIPMFTAGSAGGRIKTGLHIDGQRSPGTRLPFTLMRVLDLDIDAWGSGANRATNDIADILV